MGSKHSKSAGPIPEPTSSGMDSDGREAAPPEMLTFLETTSGASWLAGILLGKDCIGLRYVSASFVQLA